MFIFVKCCARVPVSENAVAWRVGGPGIGKSFYYTLEEDDLRILMSSKLEEI